MKSCAEFLSLSKARIEQYEKEVRASFGLCDRLPLPPSGSNLPWILFCIFAALFPLTYLPAFQLEKMRNIIPFDQMTIEDLNEVFPETKLDKKKYPYWPHKPIENL